MWPMIAIAAGSAIYSGISASNTSRQNAQGAQAAALANANSVRSQAEINNQANSMIALFNAQSSISAASTSTQASQLVTDYNSLLMETTNLYNQELLQDELAQIYENEGLDLEYLAQRRSAEHGRVVADQASSGTTIGVGSNRDTVVDLEAQFELQKTVLNHQYDRHANQVLNAQARGNWETQNAIDKMQYEQQVGTWSTMTNAYNQARSGLMSTAISSWANTQSANNQAQTYMAGGNAQFNSYQNQASQQMTAGIISGIGAAASTYAQTYSPTPATTPTGPTPLPAVGGPAAPSSSLLLA